MQKLIQGIHHFQSNLFSSQRELFERLADGQIPIDQKQRLAVELATIGAPFLVATCCSPASKVIQ